MKALTVRQPYASLIMAGLKDVENRTWPVPSTLPVWGRCRYCFVRMSSEPFESCPMRQVSAPHGFDDDGPFPFRLAIHAGKERLAVWEDKPAWEALARTQHMGEPYEPWMVAATGALVPLGVLLGYVTITGCHHADECDRCVATAANGYPLDYVICSSWAEPGVYHWTLADPEPLPEPIPMRGRQRLWTLPELVGAS